MPLYVLDEENRFRGLIIPEEFERNNRYIVMLKRHMYRAAFKALVKKIDNKLNKLKPSERSQLTWTRVASMFGYDAPDAESVWATVALYTDGVTKNCRQALGSLVMWRISLRPETWLCNKNGSNRYNFEGEEITWTGYWINENFIPPDRKRNSKNLNFKGLQAAWGARLY